MSESIIPSPTDPDVYDEHFLLDMCGGTECFSCGDADSRFVKAINLADINKVDVVLDIGGGRGELSALCIKKGSKVFFIDYSRIALKISKDHLKKSLSTEEFENVKLLRMDAKHLAFDNQCFDKIFMLEVIEHLHPYEVDMVFSEIKRVLKKDGKIILSTGPNVILSNFLIFLSKKLLRLKNFESRKYHINEQSYFALIKLLEKHNLRYTLEIENSKKFFYGQIEKNKEIPTGLKSLIKYLNMLYDLPPFIFIRNIFPVNIIFGTNFWVVSVKTLNQKVSDSEVKLKNEN